VRAQSHIFGLDRQLLRVEARLRWRPHDLSIRVIQERVQRIPHQGWLDHGGLTVSSFIGD
jgi:hypothetical protein